MSTILESRRGWTHVLAAVSGAMLCIPPVVADVVTEWNVVAGDIITSSGLGTPPANRVMAITHTAAYEAANAITKRFDRGQPALIAEPGASADAAIAAAHRTALLQLVPTQRPAIERAYQAALGRIADGAAKSDGILVGEAAAASVLTRRADDGAATREAYRPYAAAGKYVPTAIPAASQWPQRKPWSMTSASQFRPAAPPPLSSDAWARDYNEIKAIGAKNSASRSAEQTEIGRFWEATLPPIYHGLVRSVADTPGRDITQNARLFAAMTQASDDALVAVFDAKYHYGFWRPITAIRNGDIDGNDATERDASWAPLIDTPMHPEYPCAHCVVSAAIGGVLQAETGSGPSPVLTTTSTAANGASRSWSSIEESNARVYGGVHYRFSTQVGMAMGRQIGELAVARNMGH